MPFSASWSQGRLIDNEMARAAISTSLLGAQVRGWYLGSAQVPGKYVAIVIYKLVHLYP